MKPRISVIVASSCSSARHERIRRCVQSVLSQEVPLELVFVANGAKVSEPILEELRALPELRILRLSEGHVSYARLAGLRAAQAEYLCFMDDDDELLPGAIERRLAQMGPEVDVLATNGWLRVKHDALMIDAAGAARIQEDPMGAFLEQNWFASTGPVFSAARLDPAWFDMDRRYFEWTLLFFRLFAAAARIRFDPEPSFRKYEDVVDSVSATQAYAQAYVDHLEELMGSPELTCRLTREHRSRLRRKLVAALNERASNELARGCRSGAWRAHWRCLSLGGLDYLPFTRKLLFTAGARRLRGRTG